MQKATLAGLGHLPTQDVSILAPMLPEEMVAEGTVLMPEGEVEIIRALDTAKAWTTLGCQSHL